MVVADAFLLAYCKKLSFLIKRKLFLTDINECKTGKHTCDINARCTNTDGSYSCTCKTKYQVQSSIVDLNLIKIMTFYCSLVCELKIYLVFTFL